MTSNMASSNSTSVPLTIQDMRKTYDGLVVLDDVSLDIRAGEFLSLLGPSGSGKTTLLMIIAGFVQPDSGSLLFEEEEMILKPPHKRDIGMVFQNYALFPHMSVIENVAYPLKIRKVSKSERKRRAEEALELVELGELANRKIDQLSGGQRQRVALARAFIFEPRVLLMDEPLSALDKNLRESMQIEIRHLHERLGMTTVYVTHDQREALTMSDRVAVINDGRFQQIDTPKNLYERPRTKFVAEFVGESSFLAVQVKNNKATWQDQDLQLTDGLLSEKDGDHLLVIRPEKLEVLSGEFSDSDLNIFTGKTGETVYQGESFLLYVDLDDGCKVTVRGSTRREIMTSIPAKGEPIKLGLHAHDTVIVPDDEL